MSSGIRIAGRAFKPGLVPSLAAAAFIALTVALGGWQTRRADEKLDVGRRIEAAAKGPVLQLPPVRVDAAAFERRRVAARWTFIARDTLLLVNMVVHGGARY